MAAPPRTIDEYLAALGEDERAALERLRGYDTSTGTIRFQPDHPLPASLIRKLVRARIAENAAARAARAAPEKSPGRR